MSGGYQPVVTHPNAYRLQTESTVYQPPMFFGGSQVPTALHLNPATYTGSGIKPEQKIRPRKAVYMPR